MPDPQDPYWNLFFQVYEHLPRQGPGDRASTHRALDLCGALPQNAEVLDLGCGSGAQTLHLAERIQGRITAIDGHAPFVETLRGRLREAGLESRVTARVGDMAEPGFLSGSVDLIWSEGAAYFLGLARALQLWQGLLRPGACLAFTEAVWLDTDPPPEVRDMWQREYPEMRDVETVLSLAKSQGYEVLGHFILPAASWWTDFYTPMQTRIGELRQAHAAAPEKLAILDSIENEIVLHAHYGATYGYVFVVLRRS